MLVLSRRETEEITIGDGIIITILRITGEGVRIGITAPMDLPVHRREVADRIALEAEHKRNERNEREKTWRKQ